MASSIDPPYQRASNAVCALPSITQGGKGRVPDEFLCKLCNCMQVDPRVLSCFHSFCLACLRDWQDGQVTARPIAASDSQGNIDRKSETEIGSGSIAGSGVSGYESDVAGDRSWRRRQALACPECGQLSKLPTGGLIALPPHYILQHRMLVASLNQESVCLYCDLCSTDIPAVARCTFCLLNLCLFCSEAHKRQRVSSEHEMVSLLEGGRPAGSGVTSIRRQLMCPSHPDKELTLYCGACEQVVCRDCCISTHRAHPCEVALRAAQTYSVKVRERLEKAQRAQREAKLSADKLSVLAQRVELRCNQVEEDVDKFIESYIKSLEEHRGQLRAAVAEARRTKLQVIANQQQELASSLSGSELALRFADDLLAEGSDTEVLSFASLLVNKLDDCLKMANSSFPPDLKVLETVNFLPDERAGVICSKQMFGVVTTQQVSSAHSTLQQDGLSVLNNVRQQQTCEVLLVTRDSDGQPMCHGGEHVSADVRYRDLSHRSIAVSVMDRQDGTYGISFMPDTAGNMLLSITVRGATVKGSPFPVCVRTLRAHHGTFHCCSFCSSGGRKEVTCGCGGSMPGGYKGCGHGHVGHPGRRHWSCCGNILHNSECGRPPSTLYHFSL